MENEDVIREQMAETRTALSDKLETLEKQVASTVQGATTNVAETVEAVKETVEAVKDTVEETVNTVKESVEETICTVKETVHEGFAAVKDMFDIPGLVRSHPWAMFGGSVAVGVALGSLVVKPALECGGLAGSQDKPIPPDHYSGEDRFDGKRATGSAFSGVLKIFEPELNRLKGLALGALMTFVRDSVVKAAPENMAPKLTEVFDSMTQKWGGELFEEATGRAGGDGEHHTNGRKKETAGMEG